MLTEDRNARIDYLLELQTEPYRLWWSSQEKSTRDAHVAPTHLRAVLRTHVAKTGGIRYKRALPLMTTPDGAPNEAYLFFLLRKHAAYPGVYLSIDGLFVARSFFSRETYDMWDRTVGRMAAIHAGRG